MSATLGFVELVPLPLDTLTLLSLVTSVFVLLDGWISPLPSDTSMLISLDTIMCAVLLVLVVLNKQRETFSFPF